MDTATILSLACNLLRHTLSHLRNLAGQLIYQQIDNLRQQHAYKAASQQFLQAGLGINPAMAHTFAYSASYGAPVSSALQAYATQYHMSPGELLSKLNGAPNQERVIEFINEAANMPKLSDGGYAGVLPGDNPNMVGRVYLIDRGVAPNQADSLQQLKYVADALFGNNYLTGPAPASFGSHGRNFAS